MIRPESRGIQAVKLGVHTMREGEASYRLDACSYHLRKPEYVHHTQGIRARP